MAISVVTTEMNQLAFKTVLGVDPSASGRIAWWQQNEPILALPMPGIESD